MLGLVPALAAAVPWAQEAAGPLVPELLGQHKPPAHPEPLLPYPRSQLPVGADGPLYVVATDEVGSTADLVTLETLGGVLARRSPKLYTVPSPPERGGDSSGDSSEHFWSQTLASDLGVKLDTRYVGDVRGFFRHFASSVTGYVLFNLNETGSVNAALTRCAAHTEGAIAVGEPGTAAFFEKLGVPLLFDASYEKPLEAYRASRASLSHRLAVFQPDDGSKAPHLASYAVFARAPTIEFPEGGSEVQRAVLEDMHATKALGAAFGWTNSNEFEYVSTLSASGVWAHASDWSDDLPALGGHVANLVVHAQLDSAREQLRTQVESAQRLERAEGMEEVRVGAEAGAEAAPTHTVAFVMSDGDNLQWLQNDWRSEQWYADPHPGPDPNLNPAPAPTPNSNPNPNPNPYPSPQPYPHQVRRTGARRGAHRVDGPRGRRAPAADHPQLADETGQRQRHLRRGSERRGLCLRREVARVARRAVCGGDGRAHGAGGAASRQCHRKRAHVRVAPPAHCPAGHRRRALLDLRQRLLRPQR